MRDEFVEICSSFCLATAVFLFLVSSTALVGCEQKEEVLEVETPTSELEVEQNKETGATDVEVEEQ